LQVVYDKLEGRVTISATVTEAVAQAMDGQQFFGGSCSGGGPFRPAVGRVIIEHLPLAA
jgi:hypothetical protein